MHDRRHDLPLYGARWRPGNVVTTFLVWVSCAVGSGSVALTQTPVPAPAASATGAPRLDVASQTIDLGQLVRGQVAKAQFALRNAGDAVLRIESAKPG